MTLTVRAFHADGNWYRWWLADIIYCDNHGIVTETTVGNAIHDLKGDWASKNRIRTFYWFDRPYNLLEVYEADGSLGELYVHIASPAYLHDTNELHYVDHELDVVMFPDREPFVADEDEFLAAIPVYNYSSGFQVACRQTCDELMILLKQWVVGIAPQEGLLHDM